MERAKNLRLREREDSFDKPEPRSWRSTSHQTVKESLVEKTKDTREFIGSGTYGTVFKVADKISGHHFVIKEIDSNKHSNENYVRFSIWKEVEALRKFQHVCSAQSPI